MDECIDEQYKRQRIASLKKSIVFKINQAMQSGRVTKIRKIALGVVEAAVTDCWTPCGGIARLQ